MFIQFDIMETHVNHQPELDCQVDVIDRRLRLCLELFDGGRGWTQGAEARDRQGRPIDPLSARASCYCSQGALYRIGQGEFSAIKPLLRHLRAALQRIAPGCQSILEFNDDPARRFVDIEQLFDAARIDPARISNENQPCRADLARAGAG